MHWKVQLLGDPADLRTIVASLRDQRVTATEENGEFYLRCSDFDGISDASEVHIRAAEIGRRLSGLSRLYLNSPRTIHVGAVVRLASDGTRHINFPADPGEYRVSGKAVGVTYERADGTVEGHPLTCLIADVISVSENDTVIAKALRLRDADQLDWGDLYRLLEVIECDVGGLAGIARRGWASRDQLRLFKRTANSPSVLGDEARHGKGKPQPGFRPMNLVEARQLVDHVLDNWLRCRTPERIL